MSAPFASSSSRTARFALVPCSLTSMVSSPDIPGTSATLQRRVTLLSANERSVHDLRTIILAPTGRDAQLVCTVIERGGYPCQIAYNITQLSEEIRSGAGAAVLAEEACKADAIGQ